MLEKKNRLAGEIDIVKVLKGKRINKKDYAVFFLRGPHSRTRAAFIISKKVSLRAVARNNIRRKLSGVLEKIIHQQHLNNFDIVVKVKTPANNININKLKKELAETLESLNNIK